MTFFSLIGICKPSEGYSAIPCGKLDRECSLQDSLNRPAAYLFLQYYVPLWFYDPGRIIIAHPLPILCWPAGIVQFVRLIIDGLSIFGSYPLRLLLQGAISTAVAATLLAFRIAFGKAARLRREVQKVS